MRQRHLTAEMTELVARTSRVTPTLWTQIIQSVPGAAPRKWNRGLGNKSLTSKRHYMYQRLDGEATISCH